MPVLNSSQQKNWFSSDHQFNNLYPASIQILSKLHWTPLEIAGKVANFLARGNNESILDIGSGVGKFCLAAAYQHPGDLFYGIEQRQSLITHAECAKTILQMNNVFFLHGNFTQLDFRRFDHFYFYNSFYENLPGTDKIDDHIDYSEALYTYYKQYLYQQLKRKPKGTRLSTLCAWEHDIPPEYHIVGTEMDEQLKFWIKI